MTTTVAFNQIAGHQEHQRAIVDATFAQRAAFVALVDEETGVRGYLATGNPGFLEPYRDGERRYAAYLAHPPAVDDAAAQAEVTRFAASAATARNLFRAQVADVAHGRRVHALARLPAERRAFDAVRRDDPHRARRGAHRDDHHGDHADRRRDVLDGHQRARPAERAARAP